MNKYATGFLSALLLIGGVGTAISFWSVYSAPDEDFWKFGRQTFLYWDLMAVFAFTAGYIFGYTIWYSWFGGRSASQQVSTVVFIITEVISISIFYLTVIFTPVAGAAINFGLNSGSILITVMVLALAVAAVVGLTHFIVIAAVKAIGRTRRGYQQAARRGSKAS